MKAIRIHRSGGPEVLQYEEVPRPVAGPGEVLMRIYAAGMNAADWRARAGFPDVPEHLRPNLPKPSIPGSDASGIIEAVGPDVTEFQVGDAVFGMLRFPQTGRTYAEYTTAPMADLAPKPAGITHIQAAALPMAGLTVWQFLYQDLAAGQSVLINGAAGGVGHLAVQLAKLKGARVIAVASGRHEKFLLDLGCDQFIDYTTTSVEQAVREVDLVYDAAGGAGQDRLLSVLKRGGRLIPVNLGNASAERAAQMGVTVSTNHPRLHADRTQLLEIAGLIESERVRVAVETVFPLAEARQAHELVERQHVQGKIVLSVVE
ncbi:NADP-dependent oxidoreductase [Ktedonosporobacter rubrisoli]|uniref:NADP-dependent oxidoreductase n=2 Tax=Ktedonosporobacter rubrisoli TaxID=2509675 RepID=A0A4P6K5S9_KTERU|nr:NADP-dependent oxidoreductase [Ktedonosporobacter rubrisoli]